MKKWMYLIVPAILMVGFVFVYFSHVEKTHEKERIAKAKVVAEKAEADRKKKDAEDKARADAKKRQDDRDAEEKKKEDEKIAKQRADDEKVRSATAEFVTKATNAAKQGQQLEKDLENFRREKDRLTREAFDIAKQVELARIARRNAELEIQRMTEMITQRASNSSLVRPPALPTPPAPAAPAKK